MKDERIQATANRTAARGFFIWYALLLISMYYRMLILKQHTRDYWDIVAIFFIGTFYVFIARACKGGLAPDFLKKRTLIIGIAGAIIGGVSIGILRGQFFMDEIHPVANVGLYVAGFLPGAGLVIAMAYLLDRRWKRKEGLEDEK